MFRDIALFGTMVLIVVGLFAGILIAGSQHEPKGERYTMVVEGDSEDGAAREVILKKDEHWAENAHHAIPAGLALYGALLLLVKIAFAIGAPAREENRRGATSQ